MKLGDQFIDKDVTFTEAIEIEGTVALDPTKNITITTTKNIILTGKLISRPNPDVTHTIRFTGIDENKFVGGGDTVLDSDTGLWVIGAGQLDLQGRYMNITDNYNAIAPGFVDFLKDALDLSPANMRIEGTTSGQSHVFVKSSQPQFIRYVQFRYMGPRKDQNKDGAKELVTGRYACHFHHCEDGSRGTIIEGCIARDCNSHCFVPHGSHGITMRNNIVYNVTETPFWYDFGHRTNDLLWDNNLVVKVGYVPRSQDQDSDGAPTFGAGGFVLGSGNGNRCNGNTVIGTSGEQRGAGAYIWPELRNDADNTLQLEDSWEFQDNTAINCPIGISVWQNNLHHHIVRNTTIINCPIAIFHGAYGNHYRYVGGKITGGHIEVRAASATTNRVRFEDMEIDAGGQDYAVILGEGPLLDDNPPAGTAPILFLHCKFSNFKKKAIIDQNPGPGWKWADVVDCGLTADQCQVSTSARSGETIRLQEGEKAWKLSKSGKSEIAKFAPSLWGTGTGLKAEYYTPDFKTLLLTRIEPNINLFDLTHPSPHYLVPANFAARWTGKIQPQFTASYKFYSQCGGGIRMWIDGKLLIDKWGERYPGLVTSNSISLTGGQLYDIKLEFFNQDDRSGCTLEWECPLLKREFIPMSQLYPGDVKPPDPPVNKAPVANAGPDQEIVVSMVLNGSGSDSDGTITGYLWEQVSGIPAVIVAPDKAATQVTGLQKGENIFRLTVTDNKGAKGSDEVKVTVK